MLPLFLTVEEGKQCGVTQCGDTGQGVLWYNVLLHQPGASVTKCGDTGVGHTSQCGVVIQFYITQCENDSVRSEAAAPCFALTLPLSKV